MADFKIKKWSGSAWVDAHPETTVGQIVATGTPSSSTFLRGDGAWAVPSGVDNYVNITGDTMTGNLINQGYIEVEDPNDSDYVRYRHYGVEFNRSASYLRPETNGTYTLNIGSNDQNKPWDTIKLDADNKTIIPIGNVGIGTTNPKTKLNVASGTSAAVTPTLGSAENSSAIFTNSVNAYGLNVMPSGSGDVHLQVQRFDASTSVYDLNLQPSGGNVGIGTTSPAVKLDVNGDAILSGYLHATGNVVTNSNLYLNYDNSPAGVDSYVYFGDDASDTAHYLTFDNSAQFFTFSNAIYALGNVYADNNVYAKGNLLLNYDNTAADSSVYFGDAASDTAHYLTFDNSAQRFVISNTLLSYGNFITNGNIYLNNDNTAADSYVYFGDAASDTAHYLTFDNSAQRFVISNTLLSYGNFITNGNLYLNQDNTAGNSYVFFGDAASDNAHYLQFSDATQKFTLTDDLIVTGDVTVNGSFTMVDTNTSTTEQWSVTNDGTGPAVIINQTGSQPIMDVQDDGVSALYIADGGNVGIGDTTPTYKLEVAGDMAVNKIWDRNNGAYYLDPSLTSNLNAVDANLFEASSASSRDKFRVYPSSAYAIGMQSAVTYGGLNDWAMTFQFNDDNDRGFWWGDAAHSTAQGAMALTTRGELTVANRIRVGYGESDTTTPATYALDVSGNSYIDATGASATLTLGRYSGQPTIKAGTDDSGYLIMDSTGGKLGLNWYASDDVSIGLGGGNVGIGTSTPSDKLHIEGNQIISKATTGGQNQIRFQEAGTTKTQLTSNYGDNKFYLYHEGDNRMVIDSSGNTGIGTTSPLHKLQVGTLGTSTSLGTMAVSSDSSGYAILIEEPSQASETWGIGVDANGDLNFYDSGSSTPSVVFNDGGNVGIGTTSPGVKLQVQANTSSPAMYIGNSNAGGYSSISFRNQANTSNIAHIGFGNASAGNTTLQNKAFFGTIGANDAVITTSDTVRMTVASGGNVGIGTSSPAYKLDVAGDVNVTGNFKINGTNIATGTAAEPEWEYVTKVTGSSQLTYSSMAPADYEYKFVVEVQTTAEDTSNPYIRINNESTQEYSYQYSSVTQTAETTETVLNQGDAYTSLIYTGADLSSYSTGGTSASTIHRAEFIYSVSPYTTSPGAYTATIRGWAHTHYVSQSGASYDGMVQSTFVGTRDNLFFTEHTRLDYIHDINAGGTDYHEMRVYRRARK